MYPGFYGESMCISDCAYTPLPLLKKKREKMYDSWETKKSRDPKRCNK